MTRHIHLHIPLNALRYRVRDAYNPNEARKPSGEWTSGGGGAAATKAKSPVRTTTRTASPAKRGKFTLPSGKKQTAAKANTPRVKRADTMVAAPADRAQWPEHIKKLVVPPAWTNVLINPDPNAPLQVMGVDAKGRTQPLYKAEYLKSNSIKKFSRVTNLAKNLDKIAAKNSKNWKARDEGTKEHAQVIGLMIETGIRPGSERDTGAEKQAYGATTLQGQHVVTDAQGKVRLQFVGKKGVDLDQPVEDPVVAKMLQERALNAGPNGQLFPGVNDGSLRRYVSGITNGQALPKDFRTMVGTSTAMKVMNTMKPPANAKEYKKAIMTVAKQVAAKLGNTATIALNSYIVPQTFESWKANAGVA